jgi:hypothetical protein
MVRKPIFLLIFIMILFVFTGCKEFYTFNLFNGLDLVIMPSKEDLEANPTDESIDYLEELIDSDSFLEEIEANPEDLTGIQEYLEEVYTDPEESEENQTSAAVMAAELELSVTGGAELVDNIWVVLPELENLNDPAATPEENMQNILQSIIPESIITAPPEEQQPLFMDMIAGLINAAEIYEELGNNIISDPAAGNENITGSVVMNAVVAGLLDLIISGMIDPAYSQNPEDTALILWELYSLEPGANPLDIEGLNLTGTMPQLSEISDLTYIRNLAVTAGLDLNALLSTGMVS